MKKTAVYLLFLCIIVSFGLAGPAAQAEEKAESAGKAVRNMVLGWNLGNTFDATGDWILQNTKGKSQDFETAWGNPVTPDGLMSRIKALGFNAVRIPVTWQYHINSHGNIDRAWLKRIRQVVDQALDADLYCIINVHHDTGSDYGWLHASASDYEAHRRQFASIWRQIAKYFKNYPDRLLFEGFNEMLDNNNEWSYPSAEANQYINAYNQLFVDTVRDTGGRNTDRNLVVTTYAAAVTDEALRGFDLPRDSVWDHLIAEVHFYGPVEFTHDWPGTWTGPESVYSPYVEQIVDDAFARIGNYFGKTPLIIGEFGTCNKGNTKERIKWCTSVIAKAKSIGAVCFLWDNGLESSMGLIDRVGKNDPFPEIVSACVEAATK